MIVGDGLDGLLVTSRGENHAKIVPQCRGVVQYEQCKMRGRVDPKSRRTKHLGLRGRARLPYWQNGGGGGNRTHFQKVRLAPYNLSKPDRPRRVGAATAIRSSPEGHRYRRIEQPPVYSVLRGDSDILDALIGGLVGSLVPNVTPVGSTGQQTTQGLVRLQGVVHILVGCVSRGVEVSEDLTSLNRKTLDLRVESVRLEVHACIIPQSGVGVKRKDQKL
jgi:hypothetical protein